MQCDIKNNTWDDDVDVAIINKKSNLVLLRKILEQLKKYNIKYIKNDQSYKIFFNDGEKIRLNPWIEHLKKIKKVIQM